MGSNLIAKKSAPVNPSDGAVSAFGGRNLFAKQSQQPIVNQSQIDAGGQLKQQAKAMFAAERGSEQFEPLNTYGDVAVNSDEIDFSSAGTAKRKAEHAKQRLKDDFMVQHGNDKSTGALLTRQKMGIALSDSAEDDTNKRIDNALTQLDKVRAKQKEKSKWESIKEGVSETVQTLVGLSPVGRVANALDKSGVIESNDYFKQASQNTSDYQEGVNQGISFGFADEIEAAFDSATGNETYEQARDRIRGEYSDIKERSPYIAGVGEISGGVVASVLPMGVAGKLAQGGAKAKSIANVVAATGEGILAGAGFTEANAGSSMFYSDAATGGALGLVFGAGGELLIPALSAGKNVIRGLFGSEEASAAALLTSVAKAKGVSNETVLKDAAEQYAELYRNAQPILDNTGKIKLDSNGSEMRKVALADLDIFTDVTRDVARIGAPNSATQKELANRADELQRDILEGRKINEKTVRIETPTQGMPYSNNTNLAPTSTQVSTGNTPTTRRSRIIEGEGSIVTNENRVTSIGGVDPTLTREGAAYINAQGEQVGRRIGNVNTVTGDTMNEIGDITNPSRVVIPNSGTSGNTQARNLNGMLDDMATGFGRNTEDAAGLIGTDRLAKEARLQGNASASDSYAKAYDTAPSQTQFDAVKGLVNASPTMQSAYQQGLRNARDLVASEGGSAPSVVRVLDETSKILGRRANKAETGESVRALNGLKRRLDELTYEISPDLEIARGLAREGQRAEDAIAIGVKALDQNIDDLDSALSALKGTDYEFANVGAGRAIRNKLTDRATKRTRDIVSNRLLTRREVESYNRLLDSDIANQGEKVSKDVGLDGLISAEAIATRTKNLSNLTPQMIFEDLKSGIPAFAKDSGALSALGAFVMNPNVVMAGLLSTRFGQAVVSRTPKAKLQRQLQRQVFKLGLKETDLNRLLSGDYKGINPDTLNKFAYGLAAALTKKTAAELSLIQI